MKHASANDTSCSKRSDTDLQLSVDETAFLSSSGYWIKTKTTTTKDQKIGIKGKPDKAKQKIWAPVARLHCIKYH